MKTKQYYRASSLSDAYEILSKTPNSTIVAGGAWLKLSNKMIDVACGLDDCGLDTITVTEDAIEIGSMTTLHAIEKNPACMALCDGVFTQAISKVMGIPFRNLATIGGSIMGRFPFSDILTPLLVLPVELQFFPYQVMSLESFLVSKLTKTLILEKIIIKRVDGRGFFHKVSQTKTDFSKINVAISQYDEVIHIAVGARPAMAAIPYQALAFINQHPKTEENIEKAATIAVNELVFGSNHLAQANYRQDISKVYLIRGLRKVVHHEG